MGLQDRYNEHTAALARQQAAEREANEQRTADMAAAVMAAVKARLEQVAAEFGEPVTILDLHGGSFPLYANLGGLILAIEPFPEARRAPIQIDVARPHEVLSRFMVELVALHKSVGRIARHRLRALDWITREKLMCDLDQVPSYLNPWDATRILHLLSDQQQARPLCGKLVVITPSENELEEALAAGRTPTAPCLLVPGHGGICNPTPPLSTSPFPGHQFSFICSLFELLGVSRRARAQGRMNPFGIVVMDL